jgi:AraC family transcriptional regulator
MLTDSKINSMPGAEIVTLPEKKLVGKHIRTTLSNKNTYELWHSFMPRRKEIKNGLTKDLFSVEKYDDDTTFENFNENTEFEKWAAVEVRDFNSIPDGMESLILEGGLYAVFIHKGTAGSAQSTLNFIFGKWLPGSCYSADNRAHFEVMDEKYNKDDPSSEEKIWIPIKPK